MQITIEDYADSRLDIYARMPEPQLRRIYEPKEGLFIAESPMVIERALDAGYMPQSLLTCREAVTGHGSNIIGRITSLYPDIPIYIGTNEALASIRGYQLTRGVLCAMRRHALPDVMDVIKTAGRIVVLDDVENPSNVGAIFRSAAAMFMDAVLLTPDCSDPLYRRAARVSVGTVFRIPWTYTCCCFGLSPSVKTYDDKKYHNNIYNNEERGSSGDIPSVESGQGALNASYIDILHSRGFSVAAMALSTDSISVSDERLKKEEKLAIVMGNEGYGLPREVIGRCDYVVRIPMAEGVDSLNVAAASAVAFYACGKSPDDIRIQRIT